MCLDDSPGTSKMYVYTRDKFGAIYSVYVYRGLNNFR